MKKLGVVRVLRDSSPEAGDEGAIPTNGALVDAALSGQSWAQEALFRRHARMAAGLAHRLLIGSGIDAEDVVQDAFITAFAHLESLRSPDAFSSWLGSIVVRSSSKRLRRHRLRLRLGLARSEAVDLDLVISREASPEVHAQIREVYEIIESLRPGERVALLLRRVEGLTVAEVADQMDSSLSTVKRRLKIGEARLNRALSGSVKGRSIDGGRAPAEEPGQRSAAAKSSDMEKELPPDCRASQEVEIS